VDTDATLISDVDGSVITEEMWGIYYKPDWHFKGIQGGASPYKVHTPVDKVAIDPYGPSSPEFVSGPEFAHMWVSALAHCQSRFEGMMPKYHKEASGGIGCFTADSFPVFDHFHENATVIADSNHGWKMIGVRMKCWAKRNHFWNRSALIVSKKGNFTQFPTAHIHGVSDQNNK
jgi:hypothetical protein